MTRYPRWKFFLLLAALVVCGLYALPNLYPDAPAIQISHSEAGGEAVSYTHLTLPTNREV